MTVEEAVVLARHTTIGTGGPARGFARPETLDDLREALAWAGSGHAPTRLAGMSTRVHIVRHQGASPAPSAVAATLDERRWWIA